MGENIYLLTNNMYIFGLFYWPVQNSCEQFVGSANCSRNRNRTGKNNTELLWSSSAQSRMTNKRDLLCVKTYALLLSVPRFSFTLKMPRRFKLIVALHNAVTKVYV